MRRGLWGATLLGLCLALAGSGGSALAQQQGQQGGGQTQAQQDAHRASAAATAASAAATLKAAKEDFLDLKKNAEDWTTLLGEPEYKKQLAQAALALSNARTASTAANANSASAQTGG